jgi:hypothetical protein
LYAFQGMEEERDRGVGSVGPGGHDEMGGSDAVEDDHDVSVVDVAMTTSVVAVSASSSASSFASSSSPSSLPSHAAVRPDLPVRQLAQYVNPLIGTEGKGHGTPQPSSQIDVSLRWLNNAVWDGQSSGRRNPPLAKPRRLHSQRKTHPGPKSNARRRNGGNSLTRKLPALDGSMWMVGVGIVSYRPTAKERQECRKCHF